MLGIAVWFSEEMQLLKSDETPWSVGITLAMCQPLGCAIFITELRRLNALIFSSHLEHFKQRLLRII